MQPKSWWLDRGFMTLLLVVTPVYVFISTGGPHEGALAGAFAGAAYVLGKWDAEAEATCTTCKEGGFDGS